MNTNTNSAKAAQTQAILNAVPRRGATAREIQHLTGGYLRDIEKALQQGIADGTITAHGTGGNGGERLYHNTTR